MMIGIYHPPYSGCNLTINNMFLNDLTEGLAESLVNDKNIIIMGDFKIDINKRGPMVSTLQEMIPKEIGLHGFADDHGYKTAFQ